MNEKLKVKLAAKINTGCLLRRSIKCVKPETGFCQRLCPTVIQEKGDQSHIVSINIVHIKTGQRKYIHAKQVTTK